MEKEFYKQTIKTLVCYYIDTCAIHIIDPHDLTLIAYTGRKWSFDEHDNNHDRTLNMVL